MIRSARSADPPLRSPIPPYLQGVSATAIATFTRDGVLTDGNMGFFRLLPGTMPARQLMDVRSLFVNPRFDQFAARRADVAGGVLYEGLVNLGAPRSEAVSLRGAIYEDGPHLLLVAEHDIAQLEKTVATLRILNEELTGKQQEIARLNRKLAHREAAVEGAIADREILFDLHVRKSQGAGGELRSRGTAMPDARPDDQIDWSDDFSTGVTVLDAEHADLIGRYGRILAWFDEGGDVATYHSRLRDFVDAAARHFAHEERVMRVTGFPLYPLHVEEHARLLKTAEDFLASIDADLAPESRPVVGRYLRHWLIHHMRDQGHTIRAFITQEAAPA